MTNQDLKKLLKKVQQLRDQELSFEKIAKALNESGLTNLEGERWKRGAVERFYKRRVLAAEGKPQPAAATSRTAAPASVSQEKIVPPGTLTIVPDPLDLALTDLKEMLRWWKSQHAEVSPEVPPAFVGSKKIRRVTVDEELLSLAEARIGKEKGQATDLSGLIELALWRYFGSPAREGQSAPPVAKQTRKRGKKA